MISDVLLVLIFMGLISLHYRQWKQKMLLTALFDLQMKAINRLIDTLVNGFREGEKQHSERMAHEEARHRREGRDTRPDRAQDLGGTDLRNARLRPVPSNHSRMD